MNLSKWILFLVSLLLLAACSSTESSLTDTSLETQEADQETFDAYLKTFLDMDADELSNQLRELTKKVDLHKDFRFEPNNEIHMMLYGAFLVADNRNLKPSDELEESYDLLLPLLTKCAPWNWPYRVRSPSVFNYSFGASQEDVAYDIASYRDAPAGIRIWGGPTIEIENIKTLLPWLDWAYSQVIENTKAA